MDHSSTIYRKLSFFKNIHSSNMFKIVFLAALAIAAIAAPLADEAPTPYQFGFEERNANHTLAREESGDAQGVVRGQYSYIDLNGLTRVVVYIADPVNGFQAQVKSNEPGLVSSAPAAAVYSVQ